jgi:predicted enzyme related to lactoylglutathione lyase
MATSTTLITGVDFVAIPTRDYDKAAEFYGSVLGLPFRKRWGNMPAGEFQAGDVTLALMQTDAFGLEFRSHPVPIALHVDDVAAAKAELESRGVTFTTDIIDSGVCHQAIFSDPDGNALDIHHRYAPEG